MKARVQEAIGSGSALAVGAKDAAQTIFRNEKWPALQLAPVALAVRVPLAGVSLRELQELVAGKTIESKWPAADEVPLYAGGVLLSWGEFETAEQRMAIRMTRLG